MNCATCGAAVAQTNSPGDGPDASEQYECPAGHRGRIDWRAGRIDTVVGLTT